MNECPRESPSLYDYPVSLSKLVCIEQPVNLWTLAETWNWLPSNCKCCIWGNSCTWVQKTAASSRLFTYLKCSFFGILSAVPTSRIQNFCKIYWSKAPGLRGLFCSLFFQVFLVKNSNDSWSKRGILVETTVCVKTSEYHILMSSFFSLFQPSTSVVDRQDGPPVAGVLPEVEQSPQQPLDGVRPPAADGGLLWRDPGLRRRLHQMPQDDSLRVLRLLPATLHGEHLRASHRLPQGHQVRGHQGHPGLHVQGRS